MHEIELSQVKPSPDPVRKTWDDDKMSELMGSIKENGVMVPIKVRPNGAGYEIVYGHRRAEACRRLGLATIPAIVEGLGDFAALLQQVTENELREDVPQLEKAEGWYRLLHHPDNPKPGNVARLARMCGAKEQTLRNSLNYLDEVGTLHKIHRYGDFADAVDMSHIIEVRKLGDDNEAKVTILGRVAKDRLTHWDARNMADAYQKADTPELKEAVLQQPAKYRDADTILTAARVSLGTESVSKEYQDRQRRAFDDYEQAVKDFIDSVRLFDRMIVTAERAAKYGKFSPEGARFVARRIEATIESLTKLREVLENVE